MSVVAAPAFLPRKYGLAKLALALLLFLGLMSFAAVIQMKVECKQERLLLNQGGCLLLNSGGCNLLNRRQCYVSAGDFRIPLPAWLPRIF